MQRREIFTPPDASPTKLGEIAFEAIAFIRGYQVRRSFRHWPIATTAPGSHYQPITGS